MKPSKIKGCIYGHAFGDALGAPTEFMTLSDILSRWPPDGPRQLLGSPAYVTDDTQMAIAVGDAIVAAKSNHAPPTPTDYANELCSAFRDWLHSPDNNRFPGMTCIHSCRGLDAGRPWLEATARHTKGCGANMRVPPVAIACNDAASRAGLSQLQAAVTHGHPTALAASDATAFAIRFCLTGGAVCDLPDALVQYAKEQLHAYHEDWLGDLWRGNYGASPEEFISYGWKEMIGILEPVQPSAAIAVASHDPCDVTGEGWTAEEALATALLCVVSFPDEPGRVIQRAAATRGDSDSIACLAGAMMGAAHGAEAWPRDWYERIEYSQHLASLCETLPDR